MVMIRSYNFSEESLSNSFLILHPLAARVVLYSLVSTAMCTALDCSFIEETTPFPNILIHVIC
jgi:hypothetical protein